jgi:hypothetical protein
MVGAEKPALMTALKAGICTVATFPVAEHHGPLQPDQLKKLAVPAFA